MYKTSIKNGSDEMKQNETRRKWCHFCHIAHTHVNTCWHNCCLKENLIKTFKKIVQKFNKYDMTFTYDLEDDSIFNNTG